MQLVLILVTVGIAICPYNWPEDLSKLILCSAATQMVSNRCDRGSTRAILEMGFDDEEERETWTHYGESGAAARGDRRHNLGFGRSTHWLLFNHQDGEHPECNPSCTNPLLGNRSSTITWVARTPKALQLYARNFKTPLKRLHSTILIRLHGRTGVGQLPCPSNKKLLMTSFKPKPLG